MTWAKTLLKYGLGLGVLAYVVAANWEPAPGSTAPGLKDLFARPADAPALAGVFLATLAGLVVQFVRWHVLVRALDLPLSLRNAFRLGFVGLFYNSFLPGAAGGDLVKGYLIARDSPGRRAAAAVTVVADRLAGMFAQILFVAAVGGACWLAGDERMRANLYLRSMIRTTAAVAGAGAVGWAVVGSLSVGRMGRIEARVRRLPAGGVLAQLIGAVRTYRGRPGAMAAAVGLSVVANAAFVVAFHCAAHAFPSPEPAASLADHFVVVPLGLIAMTFFPAPGGVGGGEAVFGWLYHDVLGRAAATGIVACLVNRAFGWLLGLMGYVVYLRMPADVRAVGDADGTAAEGTAEAADLSAAAR